MRGRVAKKIVLITVWIGLSQSAALACSCVKPTPDEALRWADAVFAGRVIAEGKVGWWPGWIRFKWSPPFIERTDAFYESRMVFEVTTVWKGDIFAKTSVVDVSPCGYGFDHGGEYLVYAKRFEGGLVTGACCRNNKLSNAGEDLAALGAGGLPAPNPSWTPNHFAKLIAVFLLLSLVGLAVWQARRKYGAQNL